MLSGTTQEAIVVIFERIDNKNSKQVGKDQPSALYAALPAVKKEEDARRQVRDDEDAKGQQHQLHERNRLREEPTSRAQAHASEKFL